MREERAAHLRRAPPVGPGHVAVLAAMNAMLDSAVLFVVSLLGFALLVATAREAAVHQAPQPPRPSGSPTGLSRKDQLIGVSPARERGTIRQTRATVTGADGFPPRAKHVWPGQLFTT